MAFVRWRGNSAELLTTVYEQGRSRQVRLAGLGCRSYVWPDVPAKVAERFPQVVVDWAAVERTLAAGPLARQTDAAAAGAPNDQLEWLEIERRLRYWAALVEPLRPWEAERLRAASELLREWREGFPAFPWPEPPAGWDHGLPPAPRPGQPFRGAEHRA